jgi:hypothetical protein
VEPAGFAEAEQQLELHDVLDEHRQRRDESQPVQTWKEDSARAQRSYHL